MAGGVRWSWTDGKSGSSSTFQKDRIEKIKEKIDGAALTVVSVEKSAKHKNAPGLYDLTELQRDANKKFGFSAKETLNIMQRLYENHKAVSYTHLYFFQKQLRRSDSNDFTIFHNRILCGNRLHIGHNMCGNKDNFILCHFRKQVAETSPLTGVKAAGRLIQYKNIGIIQQCLSNPYTPLCAAG